MTVTEAILPAPKQKRTYPPLRPLNLSEQQRVLDNLGLARMQASKVAFAISYRNSVVFGRKAFVDQCFEDLFQGGVIGLCIAAQRFDESEGCKFTSCAFLWVKRYVIDASKTLETRTGCKTNPGGRLSLFSEYMNLPGSGDVQSIDVWNHRPTEDPEPVLDDPHPEVLALIGLILDHRDAQIVAGRVFQGKTLQDLADRFGVSKERLRQLEAKAFRKLRESPVFRKALEKQIERHKWEEINATEMLGCGLGRPVA